jgi:ABC-type Mn2+/Zn2+ transport system permease subunit
VLDFFTDPWQLEFMRRGLAAAVIVSIVAAVVGSYVILKGMAFISDALPHASFGGIAIASPSRWAVVSTSGVQSPRSLRHSSSDS